MNRYDTIVFPKSGNGTGLSKLPSKAPMTFAYLKETLSKILDSIEPNISNQIEW